MKTEEISSSKPESVKQYAKDVFYESLVTGVPNIVKTPSWKSKIFKLSVLCLCICGFLYQSVEFLSFVLTYPSVVDIQVHTPKQFLFPAVTMCNSNGIMRSKFCNRYPDKCETPENKTDFCSLYPHYCENLTDWENFKVPKRQFYDFENNATLEDLKALGHERETLIENIFPPEIHEDMQGPRIFFKNFRTAFSCYTIHSRIDSQMDPKILEILPLAAIPILSFVFNLEPNETFLPGRKPRALLSIHSPFEMVNPYDDGASLKPGKVYKMHIKMQEEELLPFPYKSNCVNYTQMWLDNGRRGQRSQDMCKQACITNIVLASCNCTAKFLNFPHDENTCFTDDLDCLTNETSHEAQNCIDNCKEDCQKYKFLYDFQEREREDTDLSSPLHKEKIPEILVIIYASDPEVIVYKYRPHYQNIEVFSYIGGYIGAWLGISLVAVADFFQCLFHIAAFAIKRKKQERSS